MDIVKNKKEYQTLGELLVSLSDLISKENPAGIMMPSPEQEKHMSGFDFFSKQKGVEREVRKKLRELETLPCQVDFYEDKKDNLEDPNYHYYVFEITSRQKYFGKSIEDIKTTATQLRIHFSNKYL